MTSSRRLTTVTIVAATLLAVTIMGEGYRGKVGGRKEIGEVKTNEEVQEMGRFSVEEYNKIMRRSHHSKGGGELKFTEVVGAEKQVVSGLKYYMKISATRNGLTKMFDSVVVVRPWLHSKQLVAFVPSTV